MSDQGEEGQVPEPPGLEGRGETPPRPTVRESFRRGLFVRLPTEGEAEEGPGGAEEQGGQDLADQYPEQVADPYPGWRQAADGSWEAVSPEAQAYAESIESAATPEAYPEIDQSANFASVAGGEPFSHEEASEEAPAWTFGAERDAAAPGAEAVVPVTPQTPEIVSGVMPEAASEPVADVAPEAAAEVVAEPAAEIAPPSEQAPSTEPAPEAAPEPVAQAAAMPAPQAESAPAAEAAPEAAAGEDPVAGTGLYIPGDVELLEGDMPLYSEKENVPPRFAGSGLGEPLFVEFGDLSRMLSGLRRLLPKGTRLTYNFDYERAWVRTSADIDLPSFAERIDAPAADDEKASS